jgi:cyanophycinase
VAIGGNEDKEHDLTVLRSIVGLIGENDPHIEIITTASSIPKKLGNMYIHAFKKIGITKAQLMHVRKRGDGNRDEFVQRIKDARMIFFTGGDQLKITSILGGSSVMHEIINKYHSECCVIAGTSAGATAMPDTMIYGGESSEALRKGAVQMTGGVGFVKKVVIDSHFIKRGRFSRLMAIVTTNPGYIGIGLGEDTGVIIREGHVIEAIGNGLVVIFDGQEIDYTNVSRIDNGDAIAVGGVKVHTIVEGHGYDTFAREYLKPQDIKKQARGR